MNELKVSGLALRKIIADEISMSRALPSGLIVIFRNALAGSIANKICPTIKEMFVEADDQLNMVSLDEIHKRIKPRIKDSMRIGDIVTSSNSYSYKIAESITPFIVDFYQELSKINK